MASNTSINGAYLPFDYGASVRWRHGQDVLLEGNICGFREIGIHASRAGDFPLGTVLALVEIRSGEAVELPLHELELIDVVR